MSHPLARLFGSLANVLLDVGLPTIRGWLRERLGPEADVEDVSTDGSIVRLRRVRIPLGPRGLIVLETASATITSLGDAGPALRLHAFEGVLVFTRADLRDAFARTDEANAYVENATFRADIVFTPGEDPDPSAWIWGDLEIRRAIWTAEADAPPAPLKGSARLFVSSREWRLEGGRLDGGPTNAGDGKPPVVARFAAAGTLEKEDAPESTPALLVPRALATLAFTLENGRIGPFLDALTALAGEEAIRARIPPALPRDTRLDGEISWSATDGARAELRLDAPTLGARATVRAGFGPTGEALSGRVDGTVALAAFLRRFDAPSYAMPREEDVLAVVVTASGHVRAPETQIDVTAREIGFRLGRARFVPAFVIKDVTGQAFVKTDRLVGRLAANARGRPVVVELDGALAALASARVSVHADALEAVLLRDLTRTLGVKLTVPDDATASVAVTRAPELTGTITLATSGSRLVAELGASGVVRVTGGVRAEDVVATGAFAGATVFPTRGDLVVSLDVDADLRARGSLAAAGKLELAWGAVRYDLEGAAAVLTLDRAGLTYESLRFTAYGGRFAGYGAVPFLAPATAPYLVLQLEEGGPVLADALLLLAVPRPDIDFPPALAGRGDLVLAPDLSFAIDLTLATPNGSEVAVALRIAKGGSLHGSTAKGTVALTDALCVARQVEPVLGGQLLIDAEIAGRTIRACLTSARVDVPPVFLEDVSADVVVAPNGDVLWNRADARLAGGRLASFGIARDGGPISARVSAASVALHDLPPIEERTLGNYVRGRASGTVFGERASDGTFLARGDVVLDEAAFPVIDRVRPSLERYGLRPPNEDATGPAVATIALDADGVHVSDVAVELHGAAVRAKVDLRPGRVLAGNVEIVLEEEYLRTSKMLTLPRVLGERLVIPIAIGGTLAAPEIKAELGQTLGHFLRENKVVDFVTSAVEEAQLFFRREPKVVAEGGEPRPVQPPPTGETELRAAIDAHAVDWAALATRRRLT